MANPNINTTSDLNQILRRVVDSLDDSVRIALSDSTGMAIELSAADGDNVEVVARSSTQVAAVTNASTGVILPEFSCAGLKSMAIYTKTTSTIVGAQVCTLQVSPADSGDVWVATTSTITPSLTDQVVVMTAPINITARRARISIAAAITSGTFDVYAVGQAT
jgi:hypothetical protein